MPYYLLASFLDGGYCAVTLVFYYDFDKPVKDQSFIIQLGNGLCLV